MKNKRHKKKHYSHILLSTRLSSHFQRHPLAAAVRMARQHLGNKPDRVHRQHDAMLNTCIPLTALFKKVGSFLAGTYPQTKARLTLRICFELLFVPSPPWVARIQRIHGAFCMGYNPRNSVCRVPAASSSRRSVSPAALQVSIHESSNQKPTGHAFRLSILLILTPKPLH